jgi:WD40 repeat protein
MLHDPCEDTESGVKLEAIDNKNIVIANGSKIQVWSAAASGEKKKWEVKAEVNYQGLKVVQITPDIRYRLGAKQDTVIKALVFLHENGVLSFWNQETLEFLYSLKLNSTSKKVVFESSMRYLASLTVEGSVEVWKIKGAQEKYWWDLSFKSVKDIINNPGKENQFIISMNSDDKQDAESDSILLFQYSRPQNLIMFWKSQLPFLKLQFCSHQEDTSYLLLVTKNLELQKIYFGVNRDDLKAIA